ncbi:hypothetical protein Goshw_016898, partial [Gossypium schwendimanii]|nr:hypothetical protein [Gossypium schwendimanii]
MGTMAIQLREMLLWHLTWNMVAGLMNDLRSVLNSHMGDNELCILVGGVMAHYDEVFRLKSIGAKADVFHMLSGMWKKPAER